MIRIFAVPKSQNDLFFMTGLNLARIRYFCLTFSFFVLIGPIANAMENRPLYCIIYMRARNPVRTEQKLWKMKKRKVLSESMRREPYNAGFFLTPTKKLRSKKTRLSAIFQKTQVKKVPKTIRLVFST